MKRRDPVCPVRTLAWFAFPFGGGCLAAACGLPMALCWIFAALLGVGGIAAALLLRPGWRIRLVLALLGTAVGLGWAAGYTALTLTPVEQITGSTQTFTGTVLSQPETINSRERVEARLTGYGAAYLYLDADCGLSVGDEITVTGSVSAASDSARANGIRLTLSVEQAEVTGVSHSPRCWPALAALRLQAQIARLYTGDTAGLFRALLTGDKSGLSDSLTTALSRCGLSHIVAVSGLHISCLAGLCSLILRRRRWKLLSLPVLAFFTVMVGSVSAYRALLMAALVLLAPVVRRESDGMTSLGFAMLLILLKNPLSVSSISFQLSFAAMLGLTVVGPRLSALAHRGKDGLTFLPRPLHLLCGWVLEVMAVTLSASALTVPLTAGYFRQVSLISVLANLLVTWLLSALLVLGLLSVLLGMIALPLGQFLAVPAGLLSRLVLALVRGLGGLTFASLSLNSPYILLWFLFALAMVGVTVLMVRQKRRPVLPLCAMVGVLCLCLLLNRWATDRTDLTVKVLDVGQGQCILLVSQGCAAAIDCGGNAYDSAGDLLADELQELGIDRLELLLFTHLDSDHINGIEELFSRIRVDTVLLPDTETESDWTALLQALCQGQQAQIQTVTEETALSFGAATVRVYPPMEPGEDNNSSLASLWQTDGFSLLVTGDMDAEGERLLLSHAELPDIDLLIVGHHGSEYSTSERLLEAVTPETAVISVGSNRYGHPSEATLARLENHDITIYRTDQNGTVTIAVHG